MMWRLPLTRTLGSMHAIAAEQVQLATEKAARGGLFVSCLIEAGAPADKVLTAWAVATGLPSAPRYETRNPPLDMGTKVDEALCRSLICMPFKVEQGTLCIAFAVPLPADKAAVLPPHKAFVALEHEVLHGLDTLFPPWKKHPSAPQPSLGTAPSAPAPAPPPPAAEPPPPAAAPAPAVSSEPAPAAAPASAAAAPPVPSMDFNSFDLSAAPAPAAAAPAPALPIDPATAPAVSVSIGEKPSGPQPRIDLPGPAAIRTGPVVPTSVPIIDPKAAAFPGAVLATKTVTLTTPSGEHSTVPTTTAPRAAVPPPANVVVDASVPYQEDRFAELKGQLRVLRWPIAGAVGLVLLVKLGSCIIDSGRNEVDARSARLADGIHASNMEAAKNRANELRQDGLLPPQPAELRGPNDRLAPQPLPPPRSEAADAKGTFDSVITALGDADVASRRGGGEFSLRCRTLSAELRAYRTRTALPVREQADLQNVNAEVDATCERENGGAGFELLRDRVSRALRGEAPSGAQPRYQLNMPPEVAGVLTEIDAAFTRQDMPTACSRMGAAQVAIMEWAERMPGGPRKARMIEVANGDLDTIRFGCSRMSVVDAAARWNALKKKLEPEE